MKCTPRTASELERAERRQAPFLTLADANLDHMLQGGYAAGANAGITEIVGAAGTAKTQAVLQATLNAQLPQNAGGLGGPAVYLHADSPSCAAAMRRLTEMAHAAAARHAHLGLTADFLLRHVHMRQVDSAEALAQLLHDTSWVETLRPRLVVLDSIGGLFRGEDDLLELDRVGAQAARSRQLLRIGAKFKELSSRHNLTVLVTNQIVDKPVGELDLSALSPSEEAAGLHGDAYSTAALGLSWALGVNTRIMLTRRAAPLQRGAVMGPVALPVGADAGGALYAAAPSAAPLPGPTEGPRETFAREMFVIFSPRLPMRACSFEVRQAGLFGGGPFRSITFRGPELHAAQRPPSLVPPPGAARNVHGRVC